MDNDSVEKTSVSSNKSKMKKKSEEIKQFEDEHK